jgi:hypothetical protein
VVIITKISSNLGLTIGMQAFHHNDADADADANAEADAKVDNDIAKF